MLRRLASWALDMWLEHWWGPRCHDACQSCACCQAWRLRDIVLSKDPADLRWAGIRPMLLPPAPKDGETEKERIHRMLAERDDLIHLEDGWLYYYPEESRGAVSARQLRMIADRLDELNDPWERQVESYFAQEKCDPNIDYVA